MSTCSRDTQQSDNFSFLVREREGSFEVSAEALTRIAPHKILKREFGPAYRDGYFPIEQVQRFIQSKFDKPGIDREIDFSSFKFPVDDPKDEPMVLGSKLWLERALHRIRFDCAAIEWTDWILRTDVALRLLPLIQTIDGEPMYHVPHLDQLVDYLSKLPTMSVRRIC